MAGVFKEILRDLVVNYRPAIVIFTPLLLLPLLLINPSPESNCGYVVLVMVIYWVSDALPLPVTGLLPVVLFPVVGVMGAKAVAKNYITDISLMLLGGVITALAVEESQFHRRLALRVLLLMGTKPTWILLGVMLPTWFLSMWISNTASAAMMIPIARAVVEQLAEGMRLSDEVRMAADGVKLTGEVRLEEIQSRTDHQSISTTGDTHHCISESNCDVNHSDVNDHDAAIAIPDHNDQQHINNCRYKETCFNLETSEIENNDDCLNTSKSNDKEVEEKKNAVAMETVINVPSDDREKRLDDFGKMLSLAVAYSATVGGTATLTGTPPNLVFQKYLNSLYEDNGLPPPISFSVWVLFGLPHAIVCLIVTLVWLQFFFLGWRSFCFCCAKHHSNENGDGIKRVIRSEYESLGPMSFAEFSTMILFLLLVFLWYSREPGVFHGYSKLFSKGFVTDSVPAILIAILLFIFPSEKPKMFCLRKRGEPPQRYKPLLEWNDVSSRFPWGLLIILGGGFAMAEACQVSGLSRVIGDQLQALGTLPSWLMVLLIVTIVAALTEVTSNTAVTTIVIPILCQMSVKCNVNPLYLTLPATMAASYAFMLPVATGVNATVFLYSKLTVLDMVKVGALMNIICILVVTFGIHTLGRLVFDLDVIPWKLKADDYANTTTILSLAERRS